MQEAKQALKKTWHFLWHEDSWQSWVVNVILAFILIKYVLYPAIGLVMGTPLPIVAVVSGSMDQQPQNGFLCGQQVSTDANWWDTCGEWYEERGITQEAFNEYPLRNGFKKGDIMVVRGASPEEIEVGDVLVFHANQQYPLIHRVVKIQEDNQRRTFSTKGDHNPEQITEYALPANNLLYRCYQQQANTYVGAPCTTGERVTAQTPGAVALLDETRIQEEQIIGKAALRVPWLGYVKVLFVDFLELIGLQPVAQLF